MFKIDSESKYSYRNTSIDMMRIEVFVNIHLVVVIMQVFYLCHRLGHTAIYYKDVKCYTCGKKGHIAKHCSLNRQHSSYSFESKRNGSSSDSDHINEGKFSAVRFTQDTTDNALKQKVRVDGTYTDFL